MDINIISQIDSVLNLYLAQLRDAQVQKDSMRFRRNLERVGELMAYEISKTLEYKPESVTTPLGISDIPLPSDNIVLATVLRAGLPLHQGLLNVFDDAENAFVSAYRDYDSKHNFDIKIEYMSSPCIDNKVVILSDPMLATGSSLVQAYEALMKKGEPKKVHLVSVVASSSGIKYLKDKLASNNVVLWIASEDAILDVNHYIVPGLGDAGDLAFGIKD